MKKSTFVYLMLAACVGIWGCVGRPLQREPTSLPPATDNPDVGTQISESASPSVPASGNQDETLGLEKLSCEELAKVSLLPENLDIWVLQKVARCGQIERLDELFYQASIPLSQMPQGYSAGTGARVLGVDSFLAGPLEMLVGSKWRGKIFLKSNDPKKTSGLNRIKEPLGPFVPAATFVASIVHEHPLLPQFDPQKNMILLNYTHPNLAKNRSVIQRLLKKIQVFDIMVQVPGRFGPLFVGKTWLGRYDRKTGRFQADNPRTLIAWYFLDFNQGALDYQKKFKINSDIHEEVMDPLESVDATKLPF